MKGSFLVSDILRDACWVSEVTLKGSRIVSEPAPCGINDIYGMLIK